MAEALTASMPKFSGVGLQRNSGPLQEADSRPEARACFSLDYW
ncbi:hypothetical protein [Azospirillum sp. sgz302134]